MLILSTKLQDNSKQHR